MGPKFHIDILVLLWGKIKKMFLEFNNENAYINTVKPV